ncbi:nonribosomal peptide synthase [Durotheca rogersii]|uniref:nonribosomal peptide synthase n=1 Tax=Durotheca rogersii TaxID=419775 RepID=UPI00221F21AB|nr:nonribosomal peptide synthase [Durotheca rogersii]KAI5861034.1 nonribosomal peptide synthase [Durotheca rogersii]
MSELSDPAAEVAREEDLRTIWSWNATVPRAVEDCVHDLIVGQMLPEAAAVCAWDGELTYNELDSLSTRLSYRLVELGVGPEVIVPLCFEKSMWMPVAMLGVMKAGGASCAIDITQPRARLQAIIQQIQPQIVLSSVANRALATSISDSINVVTFGKGDFDHLPSISQTMPSTPARPTNSLYIVFTSGSTGTPKGVVITHTNFSSALFHQNEQLGFKRQSRVLELASYAFDAVWYNTLHTFYAGGCLCIPSEDDRRNDLAGCIRRLRPNFINLTPKLCEFLDTTSLQGLDMIELAGEQADPRQVLRLREMVPVRFAYGPAECSILSTVSENGVSCSTIGRGLGVRTWVVNADDPRTLVSVGSIGELWIEGPLVGQGYWNDREKTAAAFVENPPWLLQGGPDVPGRPGRLYRTGDLVRYGEDGSLLFAGRKDSQVKIRGQRVELGEVEHQILHSLPGGLDAEVVADVIKPQDSDSVMLIAFLKATQGAEAAAASLEEKLTALLPAYMIPSAYVAVDEIPLTQTGKTDRRKLRELGASFTLEHLARINLARGEWREPQTATERQLQKLWASVLGINASSIGATDSFLRIGGDSIKAMRLVAAAREGSLSLTVADVLKRPRLRDLAVVVGQISSEETLDEPVKPFYLLGEREKTRTSEIAASLCGVEPSQVQDAFPCTPMQEGLLALTARRATNYVIRVALELRPTVNIDHFKDAWEEVVSKSPILRTRIVDLRKEGLTQVVVDEPTEWIPGTNLGAYTEADARRTMGLGTSLARFGLINEEESGRRFFVYTIHHSLCDGWSVPLLLEMVEKTYRKESIGPLPLFQSFIKHVRSVDEDLAATVWRKQLDGVKAQPFPQLPSVTHRRRADMEMAHNITELCWPRKDVTPSTLIRTAWAMVTAQYTGSNDVIFGATVSGRQAAVSRIERMTGPTIATVPVRVVLDPEQSVDELLARIQEQAIETVAFEQMGLQWIRRLNDDADRACQFQTLLVIQPATPGTEEQSMLFTKHADENWELGVFNPYAMLLECRLQDNGVGLRVSFESAVLREEQVKRTMHQFEHVLRQLCAPMSGKAKSAAVMMVSKQDLRDIWTWNASVPKGVEACVHDLIAKTMRKQPAMSAVCAWDGTLTYGELDILSRRLAHRLVRLRVGPGDIIPLCFEKSMWAPVVMLGVLRAGCAFAIVPPSLPKGRLRSMIEAINPKIIVAFPQHASLFSEDVPVISPQDTREDTGCDYLPSRCVQPHSTAAVLFTSGTTGTPKGIVLDHRCLSTTAQYLGRDFKASTRTRVFQFASYLFDVSIHETFMTFLYGGCLCVPSESDKENNTSEALVRFRANWACLSPSVARAIPTESVRTLDTLVFAGEALKESDVSRWAGIAEVFNWYGPAEFSLCASTPVNPATWSGGSIGSGSSGTCWVIEKDEPNSLTPIGAIGELAAEGPGIMRGYLNDPEKTAAVIIENPPWLVRGNPETNRPGRHDRLYRTGDLVRYNTDGSLTYIGRKDAQVKIRGQRVELGDVEHHVLENLDSIDSKDKQAIAEVLSPSGSSNPTLVVFIQTSERNQSQEVRPIERHFLAGLEKRLSEVLPRHMIPSAYIAIGRIPITANGKADRQKLREIGSSFTTEELTSFNRTKGERRQRRPFTLTERQMQKLWARILKVGDNIAVEDSFLQIGGDSIAAMRLVAAAREHGLSFTVADVFKRPRLCDLAAVAVAVVRPKEKAAKVAVEAFSLLSPKKDLDAFLRREVFPQLRSAYTSVSDALPVTHWQATCISLALKSPPQQWHHFLVDLPPEIRTARVDKCCESIWTNFDILRMIFIRCGDRYLQVLAEGIPPAILHHTTTRSIDELTAEICDEDLRQPGVLGTPFTRFHVLSGPQGALRLVIRLSHAQYDGTTLIHMMRFLGALYNHEALLPTPSFSAFVQHTFENQRASHRYWKSFLRDSSLTKLEPEPICRGPRGKSSPIVIEKLVDAPRPVNGFTPATIFTSACAVFLSKVTYSSDVTFGRLVSGRAMVPVHLRDTAGPCVNIIPVRARFRNEESLHGVLKSIHDQHIDSLPFDTIGFDEIAEHCADWPSSARYFGCVAHYQDLGDAEEEIGGSARRLECYEGNRADTKMMEDDVVMVLAKPVGNRLKLELAVNGGHYTEETVREWSEMLGAAIEAFGQVTQVG